MKTDASHGSDTHIADRKRDQPIPRGFRDLASAPLIWAVDAFPANLELQLKVAASLQRIFPATVIHPVYVLSEDAFLDRGYSAYLRPALKPMAFKAMLRLLSETHLVNLKKPRILIEPSSSRHACSRRLLRYAAKIGAGAIAVSSQARRGLGSFLTASFSGDLIASSEIPVLITGPSTRAAQNASGAARIVVFPTDFSTSCNEAFRDVLAITASLSAELHVFHKLEFVVDPFMQSGMQMLGTGWISIDAFQPEQPEDHSAEVEDWIRQARETGVPIRFINENFREPTSEAIINYVRSLNDSSVLLAIVSQTGPVASALLGSVTRDVIRSSPCPVYVAPRLH